MAKRYALVSGRTEGGLGHRLVTALDSRGYHVFATARTPSKIPKAVSSLGNVTVLPLDVTSPLQIEAAVATTTASAGSLNVLVNNGGSGSTRPALDTSPEDLRRVYETNVVGPMELTKACMPLMANRENAVLLTVSLSSVSPTCHTWVRELLYRQGNIVAGCIFRSVCCLQGCTSCTVGNFASGARSVRVRTITAMLGLVETRLHPNESFEPLPATSYYKSLSDHSHGTAVGTNRTPPKSDPSKVA